VRLWIASATAVSGMIGGPYSSESSSCSLHLGSVALASCFICTMSGLRVPISTSRTLKRNCGNGTQLGRVLTQPQHGSLNFALWRSGYAMTAARMPQKVHITVPQLVACGASHLTPRKASSRLDLPSDWPPIATISGMGRLSPRATAAA
jgi:hypothetical protein